MDLLAFQRQNQIQRQKQEKNSGSVSLSKLKRMFFISSWKVKCKIERFHLHFFLTALFASTCLVTSKLGVVVVVVVVVIRD